MTNSKIPMFVWAAMAATLLLSAYSIHKRIEVEAENKSLAIAVEYETFESLAEGQAIPLPKALADSKAQGLRALVLSEETVGELISSGRATLMGGAPTPTSPLGFALRFQDPTAIPRVQRGFKIRFGALAGPLEVHGNFLEVPPVSAQLLRSTPVGLNPRQTTQAARSGLEVIARLSNTGGETASAIASTLEWAKQDGAKVFLPQGDEVLGYRNAIDNTLEALRSQGMVYASPEFAKIAGDAEMVEKGKDIVVRLHTAQVQELDKLSPIDAVDRFVKAARERGMRILLLRPLSVASAQPYFDFNEFIQKISKQAEQNGQALGEPHPSREPGIPKFFFPILGLAISPVVWFAAARFVISRRLRISGAVVLAALSVGCLTKLGAEAMALFGSMSFPIVGFYALDAVLPGLGKSEFKRILIGFWLVSLISLMGGLCVAGMLNNLAFYVRAAEFQAVKVSVFFPIVVVGCHYFLRLTDWRNAMRSPMTWGGTALGLGVGLILAIMIARTGNDTGAGPSGGEMIFRNLLDRFLYVRPRTKEFLIGHPALIMGIVLLGRLRQSAAGVREDQSQRASLAGWTVLALMVGAIGQTSIVNTLCHIHIPFYLSLARDFEGLVIGCIIGVGIWLASIRWLPQGE